MTGRCQASHGTVRGEGTCWVPRSPGNGADEPWTPGTVFALSLCLARRKTVRPNHPLASEHARALAPTLPRSLSGEGSFPGAHHLTFARQRTDSEADTGPTALAANGASS